MTHLALADALAEQAAAGDRDALTRLYLAWRDPLRVWVKRQVAGDPYVADDVTSDVWLKVTTAINRWSPSAGRFVHWLFRIARNTLIDLWRRTRPDVPLQDLGVDDEPLVEEFDDLVILADRRQRVEAALILLPRAQRDCVELRVLSEMSVTQAAAALGCSTSSVTANTSRGVARLREHLAHDEGPAGELPIRALPSA